jgi:hypothetical protein
MQRPYSLAQNASFDSARIFFSMFSISIKRAALRMLLMVGT